MVPGREGLVVVASSSVGNQYRARGSPYDYSLGIYSLLFLTIPLYTTTTGGRYTPYGTGIRVYFPFPRLVLPYIPLDTYTYYTIAHLPSIEYYPWVIGSRVCILQGIGYR